MSLEDKVTRTPPEPQPPRRQSHTWVTIRFVAFWIGTAIFLGMLYYPRLHGPIDPGDGILLLTRTLMLLGLFVLRATLPWTFRPRAQDTQDELAHPEIEFVPRMTFFDNFLLLTMGLSLLVLTVIGFFGWEDLFGLEGPAVDTVIVAVLVGLGVLWAILFIRDLRAYRHYTHGPEPTPASA